VSSVLCEIAHLIGQEAKAGKFALGPIKKRAIGARGLPSFEVSQSMSYFAIDSLDKNAVYSSSAEMRKVFDNQHSAISQRNSQNCDPLPTEQVAIDKSYVETT
jgi:hypothetical protein